jgi:hypothetical protein
MGSHNMRTHLNTPCPYIKYWTEDGSLEPKSVANCVLMTMYVLCLNIFLYQNVFCFAYFEIWKGMEPPNLFARLFVK